jgi:hypothetical protein
MLDIETRREYRHMMKYLHYYYQSLKHRPYYEIKHVIIEHFLKFDQTTAKYFLRLRLSLNCWGDAFILSGGKEWSASQNILKHLFKYCKNLIVQQPPVFAMNKSTIIVHFLRHCVYLDPSVFRLNIMFHLYKIRLDYGLHRLLPVVV